MKVIFQKMCTIAVILYFFFPFLSRVWKEIIFFSKQAINTLFTTVAGNILYSVVISLFALILILWILHEDEDEQEEAKEEKKEYNKEEVL